MSHVSHIPMTIKGSVSVAIEILKSHAQADPSLASKLKAAISELQEIQSKSQVIHAGVVSLLSAQPGIEAERYLCRYYIAEARFRVGDHYVPMAILLSAPEEDSPKAVLEDALAKGSIPEDLTVETYKEISWEDYSRLQEFLWVLC